jgi:hypothetical protein
MFIEMNTTSDGSCPIYDRAAQLGMLAAYASMTVATIQRVVLELEGMHTKHERDGHIKEALEIADRISKKRKEMELQRKQKAEEAKRQKKALRDRTEYEYHLDDKAKWERGGDTFTNSDNYIYFHGHWLPKFLKAHSSAHRWASCWDWLPNDVQDVIKSWALISNHDELKRMTEEWVPVYVWSFSVASILDEHKNKIYSDLHYHDNKERESKKCLVPSGKIEPAPNDKSCMVDEEDETPCVHFVHRKIRAKFVSDLMLDKMDSELTRDALAEHRQMLGRGKMKLGRRMDSNTRACYMAYVKCPLNSGK